jgi:hypothetical protein
VFVQTAAPVPEIMDGSLNGVCLQSFCHLGSKVLTVTMCNFWLGMPVMFPLDHDGIFFHTQ